jgi:hypothetical protein
MLSLCATKRSEMKKDKEATTTKKNLNEGLGYSSVIQSLPSMHEALGLIPAPKKRQKKKRNK